MNGSNGTAEVLQPDTDISDVITTTTTSTITTTSSDDSGASMDMSKKRPPFLTQKSTVATRMRQAVCVRCAHKAYGSKKNPNIILDGLNMTVPKGTIYGLLGASGCGKTTLLSCIVGRRRLNSGDIWVLGGRPGSRGSGVPGPRIGYMPQELALYGEFTLRETLIYFGWIAGMTTGEVDEKIDFLLALLQLPNPNRFVKTLSGGQQRRMSLASALLHEPELLILDEPTVGVDPVLRAGIWNHLVDITSTGHRTVIITTHYIEETRQAHLIGLMRGGKFLAEESPDALLQRYNYDSLEDVFLKLSILQNMGKRRRSSIAQEVLEQIVVPELSNAAFEIGDEAGEISGEFGDNISMTSRVVDMTPGDVRDGGSSLSAVPPLLPPPTPLLSDELTSAKMGFDFHNIFKGHHMKALIWKNFLWMWRNFGVMAFIIGLPCVQIILFCLSIGHDPQGLRLAIYNGELNASDNEYPSYRYECPLLTGCNQTLLSCRFLNILKNKGVILENYDTMELAIEQVKRGIAWGAVSFPRNFSDALSDRAHAGLSAESWNIEAADVNIHLDMSNQQIGTLLYRDIQLAFFDFNGQILADCDFNPALGRIPLRFETPVYGQRTPNFTDFAAPGVILTIIFFLSVALTSGAMLIERNERMLERCLVSGVTGIEILFSHVVTQFLIMCGQSVFVLIFSFYVFDLTLIGSIVWVTILTILTGLCGMCFGFVVSSACDSERTATYMAMGSFLPIVMLCGIIWPMEGMYPILQYVAFFLPLTKSTDSLRSITQRGWSISRPEVFGGFISTGIWVLIFLTLSILLLKFKKG